MSMAGSSVTFTVCGHISIWHCSWQHFWHIFLCAFSVFASVVGTIVGNVFSTLKLCTFVYFL